MQVSLIIPVYNVEKTLNSSLASLYSKTPEEIELIFVNDGSTDRTAAILDSYLKNSPFPYSVIQQKNQGSASARNTAIKSAKGDYLVFLDADDWMADGALDLILELTSSGSDIIGWDFIVCNGRNQRSIRQADYQTPSEAIRNLMGGTMKWNLWLYTVRRELVDTNSIRFVSGADMGEDMAFILKAFSCAKTVKQIHQPLYAYNASNPASISNRMDQRRRNEVTLNLHSAEEFLLQSPYADLFKEYLPHLKLFIKLPLLIGYSKEAYETWYAWFPEANAFAMKNHSLPLRTRLLQWFASKRIWWMVRLYNGIVYGLMYRFLQTRNDR